MFGINGAELLVILVVAAFVIGPKNVAEAMVTLRRAVTAFRKWSARLRAETSGDLANLTAEDLENLKKLRNLNLDSLSPKQMIRNAVREEIDEWMKAAASSEVQKRGENEGEQK
ncbi:MAG: twin-arginine translocase TatA/TatE family subunit [Actinomycetaceae bacterium]|nr:twin-arginine translocase TatA/TatE family subunit [Actinomycetaceae bacterium]